MRLVRSVTGLCKTSLILLLPFEIIEKIKNEKRLTLLTLSCFLATEKSQGKYRRGQSVLSDTRPPICYNVIQNSQHINQKGATLNWLKISEMSVMILVCMPIFCWEAHLVKKEALFLGRITFIFFACARSRYRVITGYYVTLKYQAKPRTIA